MLTEKEGTAQALSAHLQRMSESVEQLSARIARLATILGVDLQNDSEIHRVLNIDGGAPAVTSAVAVPHSPLGLSGASQISKKSCALCWCCATACRAAMLIASAFKLRAMYWSTRKI